MHDSAQPPAGHRLARRVFLCAVAGVYALAFGSLLVQVRGLFGVQGIQPLAERMQLVAERVQGWDRLGFPTLFWCGASDAFLVGACWAGIALAALAALGFVPRLALAGCWALYLSFTSVGWPFLNFQWDALLLETGLLAVLWAPGGLRPFGHGEREPSRVGRWLVYWLLLRLMLESGAVKLLSGDARWRDGTALDFHLWTQPLPHALSWYAHQAGAGLKRFSLCTMFALELGLPWLLCVPWQRRRLRQLVAAGVVLLMALIFATGNYGFFNLLTAVLCIPLLDDQAWRRLLRRRAVEAEPRAPGSARGERVRCAAALLIALLTAAAGARRLGLGALELELLATFERWSAPLESFNAYGLFARMTDERPELDVEGSADGVSWKPYVFRYKPGPLARAPVFAGLHMPRLDWQLWFAALEYDGPRRSQWTEDFLARLLEGSPPVLALLAENPFPAEPPRFVRARVARYTFATPAEHARGLWWRREELGPFLPTMQRR